MKVVGKCWECQPTPTPSCAAQDPGGPRAKNLPLAEQVDGPGNRGTRPESPPVGSRGQFLKIATFISSAICGALGVP